uniref:Damaged DNA binding 2 n=1 Tax=Tanacetum cinerariifolium TaxID=118510 RepID=A0A6L2M0G1_TANCI|nr:damaged DNA binding 2 [Tanacetum cinerariifolium]
MGNENPIRTLGDYSKPSHEGYKNTIKLSVGNNVVPRRSDPIGGKWYTFKPDQNNLGDTYNPSWRSHPNLRLVPPSSNNELVCTKEEDGDVMFIDIVPKDDNSRKEEPEVENQKVEYFDISPTMSELPYHKYADGVILNMSVSRMPCENFAEFVEKKCGNYFQCLYYQVLNIDLERGLVRVSNDKELSYMFNVENTFGRLNLYLDNLDMDLSEYLSQAITTKMDAGISKTTCPPKKRYCDDFSMDEMVDWAEMKVEQNDKGKDTTEGVKARTSTIDMYYDSDYDSEFDSDDDSDYHSDKSVDYLSPDEEELIELRNRMKDNREAKAKVKGNSVSEMNEPNDENSMSANNVRSKTFEEHDIYINELLTKLKTTDEDGITEDPFIYVEKYMERFWHGIPAGGYLFEVRSKSEGFTVDEGKRTCSYMYFVADHNFRKPVPGRSRKKKTVINLKDGDVDVHVRGIVRDEDAGRSKGGADEPEKTQDDQAQTQDELMQRQDED